MVSQKVTKIVSFLSTDLVIYLKMVPRPRLVSIYGPFKKFGSQPV